MRSTLTIAFVLKLVLASASALAQASVPSTSGGDEDTLLSRWHAVKKLVRQTSIEKDRERDAAMVLVLGRFLDIYRRSTDEQFVKGMQESVGSPDQVRDKLRGALRDFDAAGDSYARKRGSFLSAYISTLDQSGQAYSLHVPASYDPATPSALEVRPGFFQAKAPSPVEGGVSHIVAHCCGRGIEVLGENDVLETIRDVQAHYNIDPDRIYISGGSFGGNSVWRMVARYPDVFAGAIVDYGFTWGTSELYLENAANIPIWVYHDTEDLAVPVSESQGAAQFLRAMGSPIIYSETTGGGHSLRKKDPAWHTNRWLLAQRRQPYPTRLTYTTCTPLRGRAYWLNIVEFTDANAPATVTARVEQAADCTQLFVHMHNVDVLAVELPSTVFGTDRPLRVIAGGAPIPLEQPLPRAIYVHRSAGDAAKAYAVSVDDPRVPRPFRSYSAGGLNSIYVCGEPLMIVRGTGGQDRELVATIERFCDMLSRGNRGWSVFGMHESATGDIPVKADTEVTRQDQERCNLIIVGSAQTNSLLARMTPKFPAVERDNSLQMLGEKYDLKGAGYGLYYYNPQAPKRFVFVISSPEAAFYRTLNNGVADLLGDERPLGLIALRVDSGRIIRRVMWNRDWALPQDAMSQERLPEPFTTDREAMRKLHLRATCDAAGADFTDYWKPNYEPTWEPSARWHDLAAHIGPPRMVYVGLASGEDLLKLSNAQEIKPDVKVGVYPSPQARPVAQQQQYRFVTGNAWAFVNALNHPLGDVNVVRTNVYEQIRRAATLQIGD